MTTRAQRRIKQMAHMEEAIADLLNVAEQWTLTGATLWDLRNRRRTLLAAARQYGLCVLRLARG